MTQVEQIKAEIERRKELSIKKNGIRRSRAYYIAREELLDIIANLPKEQPSEDLEKAAEDYCLTLPGFMPFSQKVATFKAGAKWQKEQDESLA